MQRQKDEQKQANVIKEANYLLHVITPGNELSEQQTNRRRTRTKLHTPRGRSPSCNPVPVTISSFELCSIAFCANITFLSSLLYSALPSTLTDSI
jgi:hypothetical protein